MRIISARIFLSQFFGGKIKNFDRLPRRVNLGSQDRKIFNKQILTLFKAYSTKYASNNLAANVNNKTS